MFESADPEALRSANLALSGRKRREVTRLASINGQAMKFSPATWGAVKDSFYR